MMKNLIDKLTPPPGWKIPVIILLGIFVGLGIYIFRISRAASYLSDKPETCVNCHIMAPQYATWNHSSHREWATCNDCHVPHDTKVESYYFKAKDGLRHATIFTLRAEPQVIEIKEAGIKVVQRNCIRCHDRLVVENKLISVMSGYDHGRTDRLCWECHREVPHGRVNSISSVPYARVPLPPSPVPEWMSDDAD